MLIYKASDATSIPGDIAPPKYFPDSVIASKTVAVPKSTIILLLEYKVFAATASHIRSEPTSDGIS